MSTQLINNVQGNRMEKDFACRDNDNEVGPAVENRLMVRPDGLFRFSRTLAQCKLIVGLVRSFSLDQ